MSHTAVVFDSALLVFREGLEAIRVLAAIGASLMGSNQSLRRPIAAGSAIIVAVGVVTFVGQHRLPYKRMLVVTGILLGLAVDDGDRPSRPGLG